MTNVIHVHFNKPFNAFLKTLHTDTYKSVMATVGEFTGEIIRHHSIVDRCPQKIKDEVRARVSSENILLYGIQTKHVLTFMDYRYF